MKYFLTNDELKSVVNDADKQLFSAQKKSVSSIDTKFKKKIKRLACIYAFLEQTGHDDYRILFIGESGNLKKRLENLNDTDKHVFRKHIGKFRFQKQLVNEKRFKSSVEKKINSFIAELVYISFIPVNFGRMEIKSQLIRKYKDQLLRKK